MPHVAVGGAVGHPSREPARRHPDRAMRAAVDSRGQRARFRVNAIMVPIKLGVLGMFMIIAFAYSADHPK